MFEQLVRWVCDLCAAEVVMDHHQNVPKDWRWYRAADGKLCHACPKCEVPKNALSKFLGNA